MAFGQLKGNFELCFIVTNARLAMTEGHYLLQLGGLRGPVSSPAGPGQSPGGGPVGEAPGRS